MLLCIDVGNSHIVAGYGDRVYRLATDRRRTADQYAAELSAILPGKPDDAIVSSVVPDLTVALVGAAKIITGKEPLTVGRGVKLGITVNIPGVSELGADIACDCVAALEKYGCPLVVADIGTATKILAIDADGAFVGGSIAPGVAIGAQALAERTALLPSVSIAAPERAINGNTTGAIQSGVVFGAAAMIDGLSDRFAAEMNATPKIIATGGLAKLIIPHCKNDIILDERLLLDGLTLIYGRNR